MKEKCKNAKIEENERGANTHACVCEKMQNRVEQNAKMQKWMFKQYSLECEECMNEYNPEWMSEWKPNEWNEKSKIMKLLNYYYYYSFLNEKWMMFWEPVRPDREVFLVMSARARKTHARKKHEKQKWKQKDMFDDYDGACLSQPRDDVAHVGDDGWMTDWCHDTELFEQKRHFWRKSPAQRCRHRHGFARKEKKRRKWEVRAKIAWMRTQKDECAWQAKTHGR